MQSTVQPSKWTKSKILKLAQNFEKFKELKYSAVHMNSQQEYQHQRWMAQISICKRIKFGSHKKQRIITANSFLRRTNENQPKKCSDILLAENKNGLWSQRAHMFISWTKPYNIQ